jgi:hypothetical protein
MFSRFFNKFFGKSDNLNSSETSCKPCVPNRKAKPIIDTPKVSGNSISDIQEKLQSYGRLATNDMMKLQIEKHLARLAEEKNNKEKQICEN